MNRSFRLVWNAVMGLWVVASEAAKGKSKPRSKVTGVAKSPLSNLARVALLAGMGVVALSAQADSNWLGGEGNWDDATKWDTDVPSTSDAVEITPDSFVILDNGLSNQAKQLSIGSSDSLVGDSNLIVSGVGTTLDLSGSIFVGKRSTFGGHSKNILKITDGAKVYSSGLMVGNKSDGLVWVNGAGSFLDGGSLFIVGWSGSGSLIVSDGASVSAEIISTGFGAGNGEGSIYVSGAGASLAATKQLVVGNNTGLPGYMEITDGGQVFAEELTIGRRSSEAVLTISGVNSSLRSEGQIIVGSQGSSGILNIGASESDEATAAGKVSGAILLGDIEGSSGTLVLNHTDTNYVLASDITTGAAADDANIDLVSGTTRFTGDLSAYNGMMNVKGGTLNIASSDALTLGHDYNQTEDGVLQVGANSNTESGKLVVAGTATFAMDSKIHVNAAEAKGLTVGANLGNIIEAGSLVSDGFVVTDNSALFDFEVSVDDANNSVSLRSKQGTDESGEAVSLLKYVQKQQFTTGLGAASVLNDFVNGTATGNGMDEVVSGLGKMATAKDVADAVAQTLPLMSGSSAKASTSVMQANSNVVSARQSGIASGDGFITDKHAWVKPVGSLAKQDARNGVSGFDASTFGIIGGLDGDLNDTTYIGFALSYMNTNLDGSGTNSTNSADIDAYQAIAYGQHQFGEQFHNLDLSWQAALGFNQTDGTRRITFMDSKAKSKYNSYTSNLSVGLGRTFAMDSDTSITPSVRAAYSYIKDDSYQESGAGALNLDVASNTTDALVISVNGDFSRRIADQAALLASAGVGYDLLNDASSSTASFAGGGAAFTTNGLELSPVVITAGVGVNYALNDATDITVRYDLEGRSDFLSQTASAKVTWVF